MEVLLSQFYGNIQNTFFFLNRNTMVGLLRLKKQNDTSICLQSVSYFLFFLVCSCKENVLVYACDCSTKALERATEVIYASNVVSPKTRFRPFCWDFSTSRVPNWLICDSCCHTSPQKQEISLSGGWHYIYMHILLFAKI